MIIRKNSYLCIMGKIDIRFGICDEVVYLNTATARFEKAEVKGVQVVPTGISKDAEGRNVLDGHVVLYQTVEGPVLADGEVFSSEEEALSWWKGRLSEL